MRLTPEEQAILKRIESAQQEQQQDKVAPSDEWWEKWLPDEDVGVAKEKADPRCHRRLGSRTQTWWRLAMAQKILRSIGRPTKLRFVRSRGGKITTRP